MSSASARLFRLFLISYSPLAIIVAIQQSESVWPPANSVSFWIPLLVGSLGLVDAFRLPRGSRRKGHIRVDLSNVADESGQVAAYVATYLLPFLGFDMTTWRAGAAVLAYFGVLLVVFLRSDLPLVNPTLYVTGWRVVSAMRGHDRILMLVPRKRSVSTGGIYAFAFGNFLVYDEGSNG